MTSLTLPTKPQRLTALRPLSPESVASLAAAWDVRMVTMTSSDQFPDLGKLIHRRIGVPPVLADGLPACRIMSGQAGRAVFPHRRDAYSPIKKRKSAGIGRPARGKADQFTEVSKLIPNPLP